MQINHLRHFIALYEQRSINKASASLNTTPQNVSRILKSLEAEMETLLFERTPDGLDPTSDGEEFLQFAKSVVFQFEELHTQIQLKKKQQTYNNEVTIVSSNTINEIILNKILIAFLKKYPNIIIKNTTIINLNEGYDCIQADPTAIAMLYTHPEKQIDKDTFTSVTVLKHQPVVVANQNHPLAKKNKCLLKELSQYNLAIYANNTYINTMAYHYLNLEYQSLQKPISYLGNIDTCYEMAASSNYITTDSLESFNCKNETLRKNLTAIPIADLPFVNCALIKSKDLPQDSPPYLLYSFILNYLQNNPKNNSSPQ